MIELKNIYKYYNPGTVNEMCLFEDFNLNIEKGEFVSVIGSNGSGKTSMLNLICGSIPLDKGDIVIEGKSIARLPEYVRNRRIGRVYQNPSLGTCPEMTILENLSLADNKGKKFGLSFGINKARISYYKEILSELFDKYRNEFKELNEYLYNNPELGLQEYKACTAVNSHSY